MPVTIINPKLESSVLVTGASGMLGSAICEEVISRGRELMATSRSNRYELTESAFHFCDLEDPEAGAHLVRNLRPSLVVHCAAITDHAVCASNLELCRRVHVEASGALAQAQAAEGGRFIHISTEAIYGPLGELHSEADHPNPIGAYATSKAEGETAVLAAHPEALVLRVTPVGFRPDFSGNSLAEWIVRALGNDETLNGYTDVMFSPMAAPQVAEFLLHPQVEHLRGIYNLGSAIGASKFAFARALVTALGYDGKRVSRSDRFSDGSVHQGGMDVAKLKKDLRDYCPPTFEEVIQSLSSQHETFKSKHNHD